MQGFSELAIDPAETTSAIERTMRGLVRDRLRRRGIVLGVSGGVDSAVVAALAARTFGPERVLALLMPERHSSADSQRLGALVARTFGIETIVEDITPILEATGSYRRQDEAIREVVPEHGDGWAFKLVLPSILDAERLNVFQLIVASPRGEKRTHRLPATAYLKLVAATSFKQRTRKMLEYYHADRLGYAVAGTPNRLEYDQGFFVKLGDGAADVKPIAHLYKSQVYQLAAYLGVPEEVRSRPPTTDTFSMPQTQEEFYFSLPYAAMDLCIYGHDRGVAAETIAARLALTPEQVERVYRDIEAKRRATRYLHEPPLLVAED